MYHQQCRNNLKKHSRVVEGERTLHLTFHLVLYLELFLQVAEVVVIDLRNSHRRVVEIRRDELHSKVVVPIAKQKQFPTGNSTRRTSCCSS
jgi:hypothetical protein